MVDETNDRNKLSLKRREPEMASFRFWLGPEREERIFKYGLLAISDVLGEEGIMKLPRYKCGRPRVMREGFMLRLLSGVLELRNSPDIDVASAQPDIKHLSLKQVLKLRKQHIDFSMGCATASKEAFMRRLDERLTSALCEYMGITNSSKSAVRHFVLIFGAQRGVIEQGYASNIEPSCWLLNLPPYRRYIHTKTGEITETGPDEVRSYYSHVFNDRFTGERMWKWQIIDRTDGGEGFTDDCAMWEDGKLAHRIGIEAAFAARKIRRITSLEPAGYALS